MCWIFEGGSALLGSSRGLFGAGWCFGIYTCRSDLVRLLSIGNLDGKETYKWLWREVVRLGQLRHGGPYSDPVEVIVVVISKR